MDRDDAVRLLAPMVAAGTVFIAGKALRAGYQAATGAPAPKPDDLETPLVHVFIFTIATAAVTAAINVSVQRAVAKASANRSAAKLTRTA